MKSKALNNVVFIVCLLIFGFIVWRYGVGRLYLNLLKTGYWIIPVVAIWLPAYLLNAVAFKSIINLYDKRISFKKVFGIVVSGFSLNYITPFVALGGEIFKINSLKEELGYTNSVSATVKFYIMHVLSHVVFWLLGFLILGLKITKTANDLKIAASAVAFVALLLYLFYLILNKGAILRLYKLLLRAPMPFALRRKMYASKTQVGEIDAEIRNFYLNHRRGFYISLIMNFAARIVTSFEILFIVQSIGIEMKFYQAIYFSSISSLFLNMLFFIPMQIGARESVYFLMTGAIGINSSVGVYISLISRIREMFWILVGILIIPLTRGTNKINAKELIKE
ncbi:MAG: lysylphosphatidylglycerol synthase transmembrane domain-containing protein [Chloroflexota bacterium]